MARRAFLIAASGAVAVALAAASIVRVPEETAAATSRGWLGPGWHVRLPFSKVARVPSSGRIDIDGIEGTTVGGDPRAISVRLDYALTPGIDRALSDTVRSEGLAAALRPLLQEGLGAFLEAGPDKRLLRSGMDTGPLGSVLVGKLGDHGLDVKDLLWRRMDSTPGPSVAPLVETRREKLLVVGIDAGDWEIADGLIDRGRMPNLERLVVQGARGRLRSYDPMMSPLIWTTMVTGVGPEVHGIADFIVTDRETDKRLPISSDFRRVKALWNIYSDAGLSSGFVGWWASHPPEPVRGYLVSELLGFSMMQGAAGKPGGGAGITYPADYYDEIVPRMILPKDVTYEEVARFLHVSREEFDSAVDRPAPEKPVPGAKPFAQDPVWLVKKIVAATRNYETIGLDLLEKDLDVVGVYFEGVDMMGHRFQHCLPPRMALCPDEEYEKERDAVVAFYEYQDEVLGRLMQAAGDRTIMVVSDHGFRFGDDRPPDYLPYTTSQPVEWHREYGIFVLSGPAARRGERLGRISVFDVAPTLLYLSGLPVGEDMRGSVATDAIAPSFIEGNPPRKIASYEDLGTPLSVVTAAADSSISSEAQEELVRNLQALGYVGGGVSPGRGADASPGGSSAERDGEGAAEPGGVGGEGSAKVTYHRNLATFFMKEGRYDEAERELRKANELFPLPKTFQLISEIRSKMGDTEGAIEALQQGLERFPEMDEEAVLWIVELRLGEGRADLASSELARWRARISRRALLATCEGKIAQAGGEEERAIDHFLEALSLEPDLSQAALAAAPLLAARGRLAELEKPVRTALAKEQRLDAYQNLLGLILLDRGKPGEAMIAIGKALEVQPANSAYLENFAASAVSVGLPLRAVLRYRMGLADPRANGAAWAGYGRLLGTLGKTREAAEAFEKALSMGERSGPTYAGAVLSLLESGQRGRAREVLDAALRSYPQDPALNALRRAAGETGSREGAAPGQGDLGGAGAGG